MWHKYNVFFRVYGGRASTYSLSRKSWYSLSPTLIGLPPNCTIPRLAITVAACGRHRRAYQRAHTWGINTLSPALRLGAILAPSRFSAPGPTASTSAWFSSFCADSGRKMPPAVLASALTRCTRMRSSRGAMERTDLRAVDCSWVSGRVLHGWVLGQMARRPRGVGNAGENEERAAGLPWWRCGEDWRCKVEAGGRVGVKRGVEGSPSCGENVLQAYE